MTFYFSDQKKDTLVADRPAKTVQIRQFSGLDLKSDIHDLSPGAAQKQINVRSDRPTELNVRRAMRLVEFDAE